MRRTSIGVVLGLVVAGCGGSAPPPTPPKTPDAATPKPALVAADPTLPVAVPTAAIDPAATDRPAPVGPWIGAAGASDFVLAGTSETMLGVWIDVPSSTQHGFAHAAVSLVIDTSGSMAGPKIENARIAARSLVSKLADGDIVSIQTFDDSAQERVAPTTLDVGSRAAIDRAIAAVSPLGATNLFDGLRMGMARAVSAPETHPIRRLVVISDGIANVGPSSPEILGELAARGVDRGVQVTALGVGLDYDEHTLNALAIRSSGRLYHLAEPRDLAAMLERELGLLRATAATGAFVEIVPAPGVQLIGADTVRADWAGGGVLRIPLGTMFGGQHREMLVRARVTAAGEGQHPIASVRLHFRDPAEGNLERIQEVVARCQVTNDRLAVDQHLNDKTQAILATNQAARATLEASAQINDGRFAEADKGLAVAEEKAKEAVTHAASAADRQRATATAAQIASTRVAVKAASVAPPAAAPAAKRAGALKANEAAVNAYGY